VTEDLSTAFRRFIRTWAIKGRFAVAATLLFASAVQHARTQLASAPQTDVARDYAVRGISLAKEGNLAQAQQELEQAVRMSPQVALYRAQLASILGLQNKWQAALEAFQKAIDLAPDNLDFRREAAAVEWQLGLMPAAEKNLQFVLTRLPQDPGSTLLLGLVKEKAGDYSKAAELLDSQFTLVSSQADRVAAMFHSVVESGQPTKIPKILSVLTQHAADPQWTNAIGRCAQIAAANGDAQTAATLFALLPDNDAAYLPAALQIAKLLYDRARVPEARQLLLKLEAKGVVSAALQSLLGNCYESERQPGLALEAYHRAIEADPTRIDYYEDLVALLLYLRKTDDALAEVNRAIGIAPNDARPWVWKGNVELHRNFAKDAIESYQRAAKLDRSNADAALGIATIYFVTGQSDEAIAEYKAGIARFPDDSRFYVACAEMLVGSPDSLELQAQAESLLRQAIRLTPESAEARYLLGQLALQQGRLQDALDELTRSVRSDPDRSKPHFALSGLYRRMGRAEDAAKEFALYQKLKRAEENVPPSTMGLRTP
jgi:tetratricopeptide (TPR) repeat protein